MIMVMIMIMIMITITKMILITIMTTPKLTIATMIMIIIMMTTMVTIMIMITIMSMILITIVTVTMIKLTIAITIMRVKIMTIMIAIVITITKNDIIDLCSSFSSSSLAIKTASVLFLTRLCHPSLHGLSGSSHKPGIHISRCELSFMVVQRVSLTHRLYINYMCEIVILTKSIVLVKPKFSLLNSNFFFFIGAHRRIEVESGLLNTHQERSVFKKDNYLP